MFDKISFRSPLKSQHVLSSNNNVIFRQLINKDVDDLLEAGYPHHRKKLKQPLIDKGFQCIGFKPFTKGLVAYHTTDKQAIGFLQLNKHSKWLYSTKFVYTNPDYRKMGVASGLFDFAVSQARGAGGSKLFLNVDPTDSSLIGLYNRLGFNIVTKSFEVWAHSKVSKSLLQTESCLNDIDISSKSSRNFLFDICQRYISTDWINFFELNSNNLINGFSGDFRRFFFKSAFINELKNSFVLVFRRPMFKIAFVEIFTPLDSEVPSMLDGLIRILRDRGITSISMKLFNITSNSSIQFIKKSGFYIYHSLCMGKSF